MFWKFQELLCHTKSTKTHNIKKSVCKLPEYAHFRNNSTSSVDHTSTQANSWMLSRCLNDEQPFSSLR